MTHQTPPRGPRLTAPASTLLAALALLVLPQAARAQWQTSGNNTTTTNNVGVGTSAPSGKLEVKGGTSDSAASAVSVRNASDASLFFVRNDGNVGFGTASPSAPMHLHVGNQKGIRIESSGAPRIDFVNNDAGVSFGLTLYQGDLWFSKDWPSPQIIPMVIKSSSGYVGVGTSGPSYRLDVQGGQVNASGGLCIAGDCKSSWSQVAGGTQWATTGTSIYYNAGSVGVGTASPATKLDVRETAAGAISTPVLIINEGTTNGTGAAVEFGARNAAGGLAALADIRAAWSDSAAQNSYLSFVTKGGGALGERLRIDSSGNVGINKADPQKALDVTGDVRASGAITGATVNATFQDVAEWVPSTQKLSAGTVVTLDILRTNHVVASARAYDTAVAGVVSAEPGLLLGVAGEGKVKVATTGRVRVKADATRSPIKVGDLLVTSDREGVAMKSVPVKLGGTPIHRPGTIIGKALEPLEKGAGEILVLLSLQ